MTRASGDWTQHQAAVLRAMDVADNRFDRERVAEGIEDLDESERDTVRNLVVRVIEHLLTLEYSPAEPPRFDWMATVAGGRAILDDQPDRLASVCPYSLADICGDDWYPPPPPAPR